MPTVTINDRTIEVEAGTNLVDAAHQAGIEIPHYCYHPRLSVVGQCRMCLVEVEGMPKLQAGCSTTVLKDGMVVRTDTEQVEEAQQAIMEFLLINHPLDCPICDQAGECGLQEYSFEHGVATSRFEHEDKRTYPGRERIPLGPQIVLNMNRCIQCTRCIRFTDEVAGTGELGFFQRGARVEIGVFPGKQLDNHLSGNVVDLCPVGALTSSHFRFASRVWNLDKVPSLCTGCDVGCNITIEHRRGEIKRYKPRLNPEVNDYWLCDAGRISYERYSDRPRLQTPVLVREGEAQATDWGTALGEAYVQLRSQGEDGRVMFLGAGHLTTEEAFLVSRIAATVGSPHLGVWTEASPRWKIPNATGTITGEDNAPNRRGAELAGMIPGDKGSNPAKLIDGTLTDAPDLLFVADNDLGEMGDDPTVVERLRRARCLVVMGWMDNALARAADIVLPTATHAERSGTFVNVQGRLQTFEQAYPPPGQAKPAAAVLLDLLARLDESWAGIEPSEVLARATEEIAALESVSPGDIPAAGKPLTIAGITEAGAS